jgi:tetratricopeptide (TPR) repeat protein
MDKRELASYAYHNCEFARAIAIVRDSAPSEELAAVHVKALSELDAKADAVATATGYLKTYPDSGVLYYLHGVSGYLAGMPRAAIERAFFTAAERGFPGGAMGLGFLEAAAKRYTNAIRLLNAAVTSDRELEHARHLSLFQALTLDGQFDAAAAELNAADRLLVQVPSLLRQLWGQLCWIRLLRAQGRFDGALAIAERVLAQVDSSNAPRLHRNACEAKRMIDAGDAQPNLILPPHEPPRAGAVDARQAALERITRKPMLHSLFVYLSARGSGGAGKEELVQKVWEENYNPVIHDDRIYKAIGRLRKLLGDDQQAPRYLTQMGRNYVLNFPVGTLESTGDR